MKTTLLSSIRIATLGLTAAGAMAASHSAVAEVDISASAGVASMYLFRGVNQENGGAAIFGDVTASSGGAYVSVWASSAAGGSSEYDLIAGYGFESGDFSIDVGVVNYIYPNDSSADSWGDFSEAYLTLGFGPVSFSYWDNIAADAGLDNNTDYEYYSLTGEHGAYSATLGYADFDDDAAGDDQDYTHLDLTYGFNDNLSFTLSKIVDLQDQDNNANSSTGGAYDDDLLFVVSYSLPIK